MPLNRTALALGNGPRGVQDARRWVVATICDIGREDLVECAEIGTSELVTNAVLHGTGPIEVRVRGTEEHPRIEVRDSSTDPPLMPVAAVEGEQQVVDDDDLDGLLLTFGRGLNIVARSADSWGVDLEDDGKVVWFAPAREFADDDGPEGVVTGIGRTAEATGEQPTDLVEFAFLGVPVRQYVGFQLHFRELRREVRLLALAHEDDYPLAKDLADVFGRLGRPLRLDRPSPEVAEAQASGRLTTDVHVVMSRSAALGIDRFLELLELTDAFCREEKLLSLARSEEQLGFQTWFFGELLRQGHDQSPRTYTGSGSGRSANSVRRTIVS